MGTVVKENEGPLSIRTGEICVGRDISMEASRELCPHEGVLERLIPYILRDIK